MHEFSIAEALVEQVRTRLRRDARLTAVGVRAGPLRMIEPQSLALAWEALARDSAFATAELELEMLPWRFVCSACGRAWESPELETACPCGAAVVAGGSDELTLVWLDFDTAAPLAAPHNGNPHESASH